MKFIVLLLVVALGFAGWWMKRGGGEAGMAELSADGGRDFGLSISKEELAAMPPEMREALLAAVREASSPEDFERRMRELEPKLNEMSARAAPGVPTERQYELEAFSEGYLAARLQGWSVRVSRELAANSEATAMAALGAIDDQLKAIAGVLPAARLDSLRRVPIWLDRKVAGMKAEAQYHHTDGWLRQNGMDPAKADSVHIPEVEGFLFNVGERPGLLLHELAHAYHIRALGENNEAILAAYRAAMAAGLYQRVRDVTGAEVRAYAATDEKEYFAEITEAYFLKNDFFPFTREELRAYDPGGFALVEALWVKR